MDESLRVFKVEKLDGGGVIELHASRLEKRKSAFTKLGVKPDLSFTFHLSNSRLQAEFLVLL